MSRNDPPPPKKQPTEAERREQRLAKALRSNLRKRKAPGTGLVTGKNKTNDQ